MNYTEERVPRRCNIFVADFAINAILDNTSPADIRQGLHKAWKALMKHSTNPDDRDQATYAMVTINKALKMIECHGLENSNQFVTKGGGIC